MFVGIRHAYLNLQFAYLQGKGLSGLLIRISDTLSERASNVVVVNNGQKRHKVQTQEEEKIHKIFHG